MTVGRFSEYRPIAAFSHDLPVGVSGSHPPLLLALSCSLPTSSNSENYPSERGSKSLLKCFTHAIRISTERGSSEGKLASSLLPMGSLKIGNGYAHLGIEILELRFPTKGDRKWINWIGSSESNSTSYLFCRVWAAGSRLHWNLSGSRFRASSHTRFRGEIE